MEFSSEQKRRRSDENSSDGYDNFGDDISPENKRLKPDEFFLDILEDDDVTDDQNVASVMKSLEAEIVAGEKSNPAEEKIDLPDLGFLFEASDDELGLPPPAAAEVVEVVESPDFGRIWGFEEGFEGFDMVASGESADFGGGAEFVVAEEAFDGGLFDDVAWRTESLPAV